MLSPFLLLAVLSQPPETVESSLRGSWRNPSGSVIIEIAPCADELCGWVRWASEKAKADARKGGTDPLIGIELVSEIEPKGDGRWKARLFVPDINKTSKAELRPLGTDQLKVTGCGVGKIFCKSQIWTRVKKD
jgi:uncharacterized protein (DUF2147 family)